MSDAAAERDDAKRQFDHAMVHVYEAAGRETGYWATRFLQMVRRQGGLQAARKLLANDKVSAGFLALRRAGRLDLTVEREILRPKFAALFTDEEREVARARLAQYGYRAP